MYVCIESSLTNKLKMSWIPNSPVAQLFKHKHVHNNKKLYHILNL